MLSVRDEYLALSMRQNPKNLSLEKGNGSLSFYRFNLVPTGMAKYSKTEFLDVLPFGPLLTTFLGEKGD